MRTSAFLGIFCLVFIAVSAAPAVVDADKTGQSDEIEQELSRHHHATGTDDNAGEGAADGGHVYSSENIDDESSPVESIEDIPEVANNDERQESYNEEDLYDITVGDVIRDVLLTLSEHPEIVKELDLERRKDKLARRLADDAMDNVGADLSDFQGPAQQLHNEPKRVQKKDGKSGMVRPADMQANAVGQNDAEFNGFMNHKRTNEVLDETFNPQKESSESLEQFDGFRDFMKSQNMNGNMYRKLYGGDSQDESESYDYRRHFAASSASEDSSSMDDTKFRLPFLYPFSTFKNNNNNSPESSDSSSASTKSENSSSEVKDENTGSDGTETDSDSKTEESSSESSQSSETKLLMDREQLAWLQHQMGSNQEMERSQKNM